MKKTRKYGVCMLKILEIGLSICYIKRAFEIISSTFVGLNFKGYLAHLDVCS